MDWKRLLLLVFLLLIFSGLAFSAEESHKSGSLDFMGKVVNFILLFGGLAYLARKPLLNFLHRRSQEIREALKEAEKARQEAERKLEEAKVKLATLEEEIRKIRSRAEADAVREKEQIAGLARQEAEKVKRYAELEIGGQVKAGMRELREYAAELATRMAEERIKKKLNAEVHCRLVDKSIERIKGLYEKSGVNQKIHARPS